MPAHAFRRSLAAAVLLALPVTALAASPAQASAKTYANCTAVHAVYSGGIAKAGVTKNVVHHRDGSTTKVPLKGKVLYSTSAYDANKKLDADHDGVACEKG